MPVTCCPHSRRASILKRCAVCYCMCHLGDRCCYECTSHNENYLNLVHLTQSQSHFCTGFNTADTCATGVECAGLSALYIQCICATSTDMCLLRDCAMMPASTAGIYTLLHRYQPDSWRGTDSEVCVAFDL